MDELNNENMPNENKRPANPRRKKRSQVQIFKEAYLPVIIAGVAALLIIIFVIGAISRGIQNAKFEKEASQQASVSLENEKKALDAEAQSILAQAAKYAAGYDYNSAVALINGFSGDISEYPELGSKKDEYTAAARELVEWSDPNKVLTLSFHQLIVDSERAYADANFSESYNRNFITVDEFSKLLQSLYDNGYILVNMEDFVTSSTNTSGATVYTAKPMYLPKDKKPLILVQTGVGYCTYMVDSDEDGKADKDGAGFASRMVLDASGKVICEIVNADGSVTTGAYDMVPILDAFIEAHPDFSYSGAKATLAVSGYDGLFGYRVSQAAKENYGEDAYNEAVKNATAIYNALKQSGYKIACYTYDNVAYGDYSATEIQADLTNWTLDIVPILGSIDTLVFAQNSDIAGSESYSGEQFEVLKGAGFKYYMGFCDDGEPWAQGGEDYFRIGRLMVTGANLFYNTNWFDGIVDASILDSNRGDIPE